MRISRRAAERLLAGHPWVYSSEVESSSAEPGEVVAVEDAKGRFLATAHFSSSSQIALRVLSRERAEITREFLTARISAAISLRHRLVRESEAYRVVYGDADLLPGLIVDRYGVSLVVQFLTQGMDRLSDVVLPILEELLQPKGIVLRNDAPVRVKESLGLDVRVLGDVPDGVEMRMNGLTWWADLLHGQKTGLFLDQRENYVAAERYARGRALDCFTSSGGFALHLARTCDTVEAVDASPQALTRARENAKLNRVENVTFRESNVFDALAHAGHYDTIVLDPPAFAKSRASVDKALGGYKEINLKALRMLSSGGVLVTCSCSQHVGEAVFLEMLAAAALDAGKTLRILERRTQAQDHPILLSVPETMYLKCIIAEVL